ncbi:hypothetical protein CFC21_071009 [Triticum aestivum]|uniref:Uncharacterized protein n=3 Tax=Triticum TaxID=4564 RepID=A0A9R1AJK3_TRITD|nr:uncharacterized protein LOC123111376 [Triticum aestivum]KAF7064758.1 hypothetical protein CFC21_071009 [Triticum aestivum]VAI30265.1 unnamed protein product [Triticum turgidum subsp. durum]
MCSMIRRFVHLIVHDVKGGAGGGGYALRNIDTKPLFAGIGGGSTSMAVTTRLPRPAAFFESANTDNNNHTEFFLLGSKIVSVNMNRRTVLYDSLTSGISGGPDLRHCKFVHPAWAAIRGKLYITNMLPHNYGKPCLEALRFDDELEDWLWDLLPSPPFFDEPFRSDNTIQCYAAGDEEKMWISTLGRGTYTFDAATATWCKEGGWTLPFEGRVQYIPEYGIYFGFSKRLNKLCSAEMIAGAKASEPPVHKQVWDNVDVYVGEGWHLAHSYLTYLGEGKFCVTRFYDTRREWDDWCIPLSNVAVMSALEMRLDANTGELKMIRGASTRYKFPDAVHGWAL